MKPAMEPAVEFALASAPAKIILFGEHGVNRKQPAIATAVDLRTTCRVCRRTDPWYRFAAGSRREAGEIETLHAFRATVDELRAAAALDQIRELARDFFAPTRYVLAHVLAELAPQMGPLGVEVEWRSALPIGSGLGSGAAANTAMVRAVYALAGQAPSPAAVIQAAWQGDVIAHGGVASSLDSSTSTYGGLIRYTTAAGAEPLPLDLHLPVVIGDTQVQHNTAALNTHVRRWLEEKPVRLSLFGDMGWLVGQATAALERSDTATLGHVMNVHQLLQEKMGTSVPQAEALIDAARAAGALGAKISGSGGGGIIIALVPPHGQAAVADAINAAGGRAYTVTTGAPGVRLEDASAWDAA